MKATPLTGIVHATCVTDEELLLERALDCTHIDFQDNLTGGICNDCGAEWSEEE